MSMGSSIPPVKLLLRVAFALLFTQQVNALYFLIDGTSEKCFYEDLPKDTIVVGKQFPFAFFFFLVISKCSFLFSLVW